MNNNFSSKFQKTSTDNAASAISTETSSSFPPMVTTRFINHSYQPTFSYQQPYISESPSTSAVASNNIEPLLDQVDIPGILPSDITDWESEDLSLFLQN